MRHCINPRWHFIRHNIYRQTWFEKLNRTRFKWVPISHCISRSDTDDWISAKDFRRRSTEFHARKLSGNIHFSIQVCLIGWQYPISHEIICIESWIHCTPSPWLISILAWVALNQLLHLFTYIHSHLLMLAQQVFWKYSTKMCPYCASYKQLLVAKSGRIIGVFSKTGVIVCIRSHDLYKIWIAQNRLSTVGRYRMVLLRLPIFCRDLCREHWGNTLGRMVWFGAWSNWKIAFSTVLIFSQLGHFKHLPAFMSMCIT